MNPLWRSLRGFNYRLWAAGALLSNIGTWMQLTTQDWLVLTRLTAHSAHALGLVMALQFGPQVLLLPLTGYAADHCRRRRLLCLTQSAMGLLALALGLLTLAGRVNLAEVEGFALLLGCMTAFDTPARQTMVALLVGEADLSNAVALNAASFSAARMIGPALAGLLTASVGAGWVFLLNAASYGAVIVALLRLRVQDLHGGGGRRAAPGKLSEGFVYLWRRADLRAIMLMLFLIGTFGLNFPIFIATMSVSVFHADARQYGLLFSSMALGSIGGALLSARRARADFSQLCVGSLLFALACTAAAIMPDYAGFALALLLAGAAIQTVTTSCNSLVQLSTEPGMRGRVIAILMAITLGGTPLGALLVGWVADHCGARWALAIAAVAGLVAGVIALRHLRARPLPGAAPTTAR
jgi:MFS family permease